MKFNHIGIPTTTRFEGEIDLPHLRVTVSDHQSNPFGIQWQRYWEGARRFPTWLRPSRMWHLRWTTWSSPCAGKKSSFLRTAQVREWSSRSSKLLARRSNSSK